MTETLYPEVLDDDSQVGLANFPLWERNGRTNLTKADDLVEGQAEDAIYLYLQEIARKPLLTAAEEVQLAKNIASGQLAQAKLKLNKDQLSDQQSQHLEKEAQLGNLARKDMIEANLRLVVNIAKKYLGRGLPLLDLIQEGNIGLMKAVEKFDHKKGFRFSTYAFWWIRQAVSRATAEQARTIRFPIHIVEKVNKIASLTPVLQQEQWEQPSHQDYATRLGWAVGTVRTLRSGIPYKVLSLEAPAVDDEEGKSDPLWAHVKDEAVDTETEAERGVLKEEVAGWLDEVLTPREAKIMKSKFGLEDGKQRTLEEVGKEFELTRERIRQIEQEAFDKLRVNRRTRHFSCYL